VEMLKASQDVNVQTLALTLLKRLVVRGLVQCQVNFDQ
jgi:hypothetical protein